VQGFMVATSVFVGTQSEKCISVPPNPVKTARLLDTNLTFANPTRFGKGKVEKPF